MNMKPILIGYCINVTIYNFLFFYYYGSEENVYLLCKKLREDGIAKPDGSDLYVVVISNEKKQASNLGKS